MTDSTTPVSVSNVKALTEKLGEEIDKKVEPLVGNISEIDPPTVLEALEAGRPIRITEDRDIDTDKFNSSYVSDGCIVYTDGQKFQQSVPYNGESYTVVMVVLESSVYPKQILRGYNDQNALTIALFGYIDHPEIEENYGGPYWLEAPYITDIATKNYVDTAIGNSESLPEVSVSATAPTDENVKLWVDTTQSASSYATQSWVEQYIASLDGDGGAY